MRRVAVAVFLVLVLALVVGADRAAEQIAEDRIAARLAADLGRTPEVEVLRAPFLTQAVRGRYHDLRVRADQVRLRDVPVRDFEATLSGVRLPLRTALSGGGDAVPVERLDVTGVLAWSDLQAAIGRPDLRIGPAGDGVRVSGTVSAFGQQAPAVALADVELDSGAGGGATLALRVRSIEVAGAAYTGPLPEALGGGAGLRVPVPPLPYDLRLSGVEPTERGLVLRGSGRDVVLRQG